MTTTLTADEVRELTGYSTPARQIRALHAAGYWLARITPLGVSLPRAHYEAVCGGARQEPAPHSPQARPQVRTQAMLQPLLARR